MDNLLNEIGLEVEFQIYDLIAFTTDDGLQKFVPNSSTITDIKKDYDNTNNRAIEDFLRKNS